MISLLGAARTVGGENGSGSGDTGPSVPLDALIIVTASDTVLLPGTVIPMTIGQPRAIAARRHGPSIRLLNSMRAMPRFDSVISR